MCGRFGFFELAYFIEQLRQLELPFEEATGFSYRQNWNIVPDSGIVALLGDHGLATLSIARWGLIPHWSESLPKVRPINARADSLASKPFFRHMLHRHHCLVPASGFYEWKALDAKAKEPWYFHRSDGRPMAMAGLWDEWRRPGSDDLPLVSCTIVTTEANRQAEAVHARMPVILEPETWTAWLDSANRDSLKLLKPCSDGILDLYPVSKRVNNPSNSGAECIEKRPGST